jgi:hypothetical protein
MRILGDDIVPSPVVVRLQHDDTSVVNLSDDRQRPVAKALWTRPCVDTTTPTCQYSPPLADVRLAPP